MKLPLTRFIGFTAIALLISVPHANAQLTVPRVETGVQFVVLKLPDPIGEHAPGVGARFGYNFSNYFGLDAGVNHFPGGSKQNSNFGESPGLFGVKAGYGGSYGGIYAKVRPGFMHFSRDSAIVGRGLKNQDYFALDLGIVAERYWRNHTYLRFDAGDTIISYGGERYLSLIGTPVTLNGTHNPQFSIGIGLHF